MDIFKLIFEHDITLEHLSGHEDPRNREKDRDALLASFLKPQKTYNRYYFTGTRIREERFGLDVLETWPEIIKTLDAEVTPASGWHLTDGNHCDSLPEAVRNMQPFEVLISGRTSDDTDRRELVLDAQTGIRERFRPLARLLDRDHLVLISEKAHHGVDLHLFSRHNLYEQLFKAYQRMVGPRFRYFSINGKRVGSERQFYFETWTLERPPHGFQEVTPDAKIR